MDPGNRKATRGGVEVRRPFKLPELPYGFDALEPHIDARTMEIHHGKHHAAYTNNLNAALEKHPELQGKSVEELLRDPRVQATVQVLRNR